MEYGNLKYGSNGTGHDTSRSKLNYKKLRYLSQFALDKGAQHTKIISVKTIITSPWVSLKCRYDCELYGNGKFCPPNSPRYDEVRGLLNSYDKAIIIQGNDNALITNIAMETENEAFLSGSYKAFALGAGPCKLTPDSVPLEGFKEADLKRPFLNAVGIDAFQTARNNGFRIDVLYSPEIKPNYISLVLIE